MPARGWTDIKMNIDLHIDEHNPAVAIEALVARYGVLRIAAAMLRAMMRTRPATVAPSDLSERMRRDIGLPPEPASPKYWDIVR